MKDPEFIELRNKFLFAVFIAIVFAVPLLFFVYKTYSNTNVLSKINKKDTFTILVINKNCDTCKVVDDILHSNKVKYVKLNRDTNKNYDEIMKKMGVLNKREEFPIIIYVEEGKMKANLFNINNEEDVTDFLNSHNIINSK